MRSAILFIFGVLLGAGAWNSSAIADVLPEDADGWHSWQVDEPGASTEMCCFTWRNKERPNKGCNLDGRSIAFSNSGDCSAAPGTIQVYIRLGAGIPQDIVVLSSNCPVSTETTVTDHGLLSATENLRWFRSVIEDRQLDNDVREEALFALVNSSSEVAYAYLDKLLTSR